MALISLMTDFGYEDVYVGTMKGIILSIAPETTIVDLTHDIPPQDVQEGAFLLAGNYRFFPRGTIHTAVVDPGVGSSRRPVAIQAGGYCFVGPDNGIFTRVLEQEKEFLAVHLTNSKYHREEVSRTFHGRDIFAPVAAHLANGVPLTELGERIFDPLRLTIVEPEEMPEGLRLHIMRIDRFGNLVTDLTEERFSEWSSHYPNREPTFYIGRRRIQGIRESYSEVPPGLLLAVFGSSGRLELAVNQGSAKDELNATRETPIMVSVADDSWTRGA